MQKQTEPEKPKEVAKEPLPAIPEERKYIEVANGQRIESGEELGLTACFRYNNSGRTQNLITISYRAPSHTFGRVDPLHTGADAEIYVSAKEPSPGRVPAVSLDNCIWKANAVGPASLQIDPADPNYSAGCYYICVASKLDSANKFALRVCASEKGSRFLHRAG